MLCTPLYKRINQPERFFQDVTAGGLGEGWGWLGHSKIHSFHLPQLTITRNRTSLFVGWKRHDILLSHGDIEVFHDIRLARPQVADGGAASDMEGSCEYVE
jgi:hypothetical protein